MVMAVVSAPAITTWEGIVSIMHVSVLGIWGRRTVQKQISNNLLRINDIRMGRHGLDEILQKIRPVLPEDLVLALQASSHLLDSDVGDVGDIGRAQVDDRVFVQPVIHPRHLATDTEVVNGLISDGQRAIKVTALLHETELGAEGHDAEKVPGVVAEPFAELALLFGIDIACLEMAK